MTGKELERLIELVKEKDRGAVPAKSSPELPAKKAVPVKPGEQRKKEEKRPGSSRYKTGFTKEETNGKGKTAEKGNGKKPFAGQPGKPMKKTPGVRSADTEKAKAPAKPGINGKARPGKGKKGTLRVISLGGLQEIGKNITVLEYENDIVIIDCGMGFPDEDMPGVDLVIPDFTYLEKNASKIRGILLTHGHEDHIGGVPYLLKVIHAPVYGTPLTIGILSRRLEEFSYDKAPVLKTVAAGDTVALGTAFRAEFIHVNHSIADACAICLSTPLGNVVHSGDFKLDVSPIDGKMMDVVRLGQLGNEGVKLLLCESTNAERPGFTPSERKVGGSLEQIFLQYPKNRLVIATFSSNVHRVQQIIDAAARHHRKVAVLGRSMENVIGAAMELGYMDVPDGVLIDLAEMKRFKPEETTLITTGSQGEPMSALYRMAFEEHDKVKLTPSDVVVLSATAIPGNEKLVGKIINALVKNGVRVYSDPGASVHVSGHACQEEIKLMHALTKPEYVMPIHGEYRHLYAHKDIAEFMGTPANRIFVSEIGKVLEVTGSGCRFGETVPAGHVLVDGSVVGDVGSVVLRDRKHLAEDGLIVTVATVDLLSRSLLSGPDIISRGFVYVKESGNMMDEAKAKVQKALETELAKGTKDLEQFKKVAKDVLSRYFFDRTKRKPMVLTSIMAL